MKEALYLSPRTMLTPGWGSHIFFILLIISLHGCHCTFLAPNISPPSGTTVRELPGSTVMFNCSIYSNSTGNQAITEWRLSDIGQTTTKTIAFALDSNQFEYDGMPLAQPIATIVNTRNVLIFPQYNLHNRILQCALGSDVFAEYFLFTYRTPQLTNLTEIRIISGTEISLNMEGDFIPAYPYPTFAWTNNGVSVSNSSVVTFGYPIITFSPVDLSLLSSEFILSASNYFYEDPSRLLGSDRGSLTLDILYGPSMRRGDSQRAAKLGVSLSLLCGDQLRSNPGATISWQHPNGSVITDSARHTLVNNATGIKLNFTPTVASDNGLWTCSIVVTATNVTVPPQRGITPSVKVGEERFQINVLIVDTPGQPTNLLVDDIGGTWAFLTWTQPSEAGLQGVSFYVVTAKDVDLALPDRVFNSLGNRTEVNMTNLLPVTSYNFTVQAVSKALDVEVRGQSSTADSGTTLLSAPAPTCTSAVESNGGIRVDYGFIHTGGQDVTMVEVTYVAIEIGGNTSVWDGLMIDVDSTSVLIQDLVAGNAYTVGIIASNLNGSSEAYCPILNLTMGWPQPPSKPIATELEDGNVVRLEVQSFFPGSHTVHFIVTSVLITQQSESDVQETRKTVSGYIAGSSVEIIISGLLTGSKYRFRVTIENEFGSSSAISDSIVILGPEPTTSPTSIFGTTFYIVVGVVGSLVVLSAIIIVVVLVVIAMLRKRQRHKAYEFPQQNGEDNVIEENFEAQEDQVKVVLRERMPENEEVIVNDLYENLGSKRIEALRPSYYDSSPMRTPEPQLMEMTEVVAYMNVSSTSSTLKPSNWD